MEVVQGADIATLNMGIGWRGLKDEMERFKDNLECTKLKNNQQGVDPDDVYSQVPYEKGFQFVLRIERQVSFESPNLIHLKVLLLLCNVTNKDNFSGWEDCF